MTQKEMLTHNSEDNGKCKLILSRRTSIGFHFEDERLFALSISHYDWIILHSLCKDDDDLSFNKMIISSFCSLLMIIHD